MLFVCYGVVNPLNRGVGKMIFDSLALCGGGGKGAYQIGLWKALDELDLVANIRAVSGTSIGGLNAVLFALGDFQEAKRIWYSVREEDVFPFGSENTHGFFSRSGLQRILKTLSLRRLSEAPIKVYVNVYNVSNRSLEWKHLNELPENQQIDYLLATSALPVIYGHQSINKRPFLDGGVAFLSEGNIPIAPLYENGYRNILLSSLNHNFSFGPQRDILKGENMVKKYPDAKITPLLPLESLGGFMSGTLNFAPSSIRNCMISGYYDTYKQLKREDVYVMKNNYSKINIQIRNQMERLFHSGAEIESFIRTTNFSNINLEMPTSGGHVFYTDIVAIDGWRLQQHNVPFLTSHYRFLNPKNVRIAWVLNPDDIIRALDDYESVMKFNSE